MFIARYCDLLNVVISCDGCERMAPWHRYRCLQCMDMDLCKTCFLSEFSLSTAANVTLGRTHQCSRSVAEHVLLQVVPNLRATRTITRWSTWSTPVTTARVSSSAAGSTATSAKTLTSALVVTTQRNILTGETFCLVVFEHADFSLDLFFSNQTFPRVATCPLIGSQCTPWSPYGSAIVTD